MKELTKHQIDIVIAALKLKQYNYLPGDRMYKEYEDILKILRTKNMTASDWE